MSNGYQIVVCGSVVPDPLQTLEPVMGPDGPSLRNEMMLPAVLDPWAMHALFEAAHLAKQHEGSKVWLVALGPKGKLQQLMMNIGQKVPFELVAVDAPAGGFTESFEIAENLAEAIGAIPNLDRSRLLLFGGWESASRGAGTTMQWVGEKLGIVDQFQGVDELGIAPDGLVRILERIEGGRHQVAICRSLPILVGWATGKLPEPPNNPQVGMLNMRSIMPALQRSPSVQLGSRADEFKSVKLPEQRRQTRIVKDASVEDMAREIVAWIRGE